MLALDDVLQQLPAASSILQPYCDRFGVQLLAAPELSQWIEDRLRDVPINPEAAISFKDELLDHLTRILYSGSSTAVLMNFWQQMAPLDLYLEMIHHVRCRHQQPQNDGIQHGFPMISEIHNELLLLEQNSQNIDQELLDKGFLNETLIARTFELVKGLRGKLSTLLKQWKTFQATEATLPICAPRLDNLQSWYERLFAQNWSILLSVNAMEQIFPGGALAHFREQGKNLSSELLKDGFLVEKQPPQVMRTKTQYHVTVRHLVGEWLHDKLIGAQMKVSIISESEARATQQFDGVPPKRSCGHLGHDETQFEYNQQTGSLTVDFRNLQIKKIIRTERRGQDCVLDEKSTLLFYFTIQSGDFIFMPWVMSLPIVVIVHCNQEIQSLATIVWDNAAFDINRLPFYVPRTMPWRQLADTLNRRFVAATERALTEENLHFLCEKALRREVPYPVPHDIEVTWSQFCKEMLPGRGFTFWEWFHTAMKVTKDHLKTPWKAGYVFGFVNKHRVEALLRGYPAGTFLLRFADSLEGAITIAYVASGRHGQSDILHVAPFTNKELASHPLSSSINELKKLRFVYPDVPKAEAFVQYVTAAPQTGVKPYVPKKVQITILEPSDEEMSDGGSGNSTNSDNHQSPMESASS